MLLLVVVLLLATGVSLWVNVPPWLLRKRATDHYRLGMGYERSGKVDRALAEWRIAASIDRDFPDPYYRLGDYLLNKADRPDLAVQNFRWLATIDPHGPHIYCRLTQALALQNELAEARGFAAIALKSEPTCALTHHVVGILLITEHRIREGLPHLELAYKNAPDNPVFGTVLAKAYLDISDFPRAVAILSKLLQRDPKNAEAHYLLGWAYNRSTRTRDTIERAESEFREATRLQPADAESSSELGKLHLQTGKLAEARTDLERALQVNPRLVQAANSLILVYRGLGLNEAAIKMERQARTLMERSDRLRALQKRAEIHRDAVNITIQLAAAELDDGNLTDALRYVQAVLARRPADRAALQVLEKVYIVGGKPDMADTVHAQLSKLPGSIEAGPKAESIPRDPAPQNRNEVREKAH